ADATNGSCHPWSADTGPCARETGFRSSEVLREWWSGQTRHPQRQPSPGCDQALIPRVDGAQVRHRLAADQKVLVVQLLGHKAPVPLEIVGTGASLTASEIEQTAAALPRAFH